MDINQFTISFLKKISEEIKEFEKFGSNLHLSTNKVSYDEWYKIYQEWTTQTKKNVKSINKTPKIMLSND